MKLAKILIYLVLVWIAGIFAIAYCFRENKVVAVIVGMLFAHVTIQIFAGVIDLWLDKKEEQYIIFTKDTEDDEEEI